MAASDFGSSAHGAVALGECSVNEPPILSRSGECRILHEQPLQIGRTSNSGPQDFVTGRPSSASQLIANKAMAANGPKLAIPVTYIGQQIRLVEALELPRGTLWASQLPQPYWRASHPAALYATNPPPPSPPPKSQFRTIQALQICLAHLTAKQPSVSSSCIALSLHCFYPANFPQVLLRHTINPSV